MPKKLVKQKQKQKQSVIVNVNVAKSQTKSRGKTRAKKSGGGGSVMMLPPPIYSHPISNLIPQAFSKEGKQMSQPTLEDQVNAVLKKRYEDERQRELSFRRGVANTPIIENKPQSILREPKENKPFTPAEEVLKVFQKKQSSNLLEGPAKNLGLIEQLMKRQEKMKPKTEQEVKQMEEQIKQRIPGQFKKEETQLKPEEIISEASKEQLQGFYKPQFSQREIKNIYEKPEKKEIIFQD